MSRQPSTSHRFRAAGAARRRRRLALALAAAAALCGALWTAAEATQIGREVAIPRHLADGEEYTLPIQALLDFGKRLFAANWTVQEGGGRPLTKGTGTPLSDPSRPLVFPRNFNRISSPEANSCAGCHNSPFGIPGGNGDIVGNVFVLAQRFDFANFDLNDPLPTVSSHDERGRIADLSMIANSRSTLGMFGSGYIEMLARQMTADLQSIRNGIAAGGAQPLVSKGISFGTLRRRADGSWDTSAVEGLPAPSLASSGPASPPNLIIRPFHQAGAVVSLRQFTNNALNHHHGIQTEERFGVGTDPDGDGFVNEATRADVTALSLYQAALAVPGRVIPHDRDVEDAVLLGERLFTDIGCATCHVPQLPLDKLGWLYSEPNPYNPSGNLRPGDAPGVLMNLNGHTLPAPRLRAAHGVTMVPAFTDLKLHDLTSGPDDPNREPLDMQQSNGSTGFFAGNSKFITRKLWGVGNKPNFYHHGQFTTMRESVLAHGGEAQSSTNRFKSLSENEQDSLIEFLKSLQVLPPGTESLIVDERFKPRSWPPPR
jgi:Di-haem oxidoreductase, putative peroxidase